MNGIKTHPLKKVKRFRFWKVFWVVLGLYVLLILFGVIATSLAPVNPEIKLAELLHWKKIVGQCITFLFIVLYYYLTLNIFYNLIIHRKSAMHYIKACLVIVIVLVTWYVVYRYFFPEPEKYRNQMTTGVILFSHFIATVFYLGVSMLISYFTYLWDERKQRKILEEQKMQLEVEKSTANFNFLKAQINPHFLHNTLNFLYAKSLPYSEELSEGILTLSDIMRYALSEGNAKDGKAPLKDEIEHVRNVIKINQLRFSNKLNVQFEVEGVVNGATIIPFVLITLVENAFKHGDLKHTSDPIDIRLKVDNHTLYFYCRNRKKSGPKELSTGIGLENIKKRLDLAYGKDYSFQVKDEAEFYTTELTITRL